MSIDPLRVGDPGELGGYRLLGRLGEGGMGTVYLGRSRDGRLVAVKAIRRELADQAEFRGRFRSEVSRARAVPAFCTAPVLDADPEHETPYLVVEYVDGPSLAEVVGDRGPLGGGDLHSVAIGVATALTAIHGAGVIHRDLKPRNVLFALGSPKVIDFGLARPFEATSAHTRTDQMVGTVAYMAPERFDADSPGVGPAADIFAWGVVVTYAGTGRTPFGADSPAATAARILTQPPDLRRLDPPLRGIVARTLAKDPAERPTAPELLELLLDSGSHSRAGLTGRPELQQAAQAARASSPPAPRTSRRGVTVAVAGVAAAALLGTGGLWAATRSPAPDAGAAAKVTAPAENAPAQAAPASSAAASPRPSGAPARPPAIADPLDREDEWSAADDEYGTCTFTGGRMVATAHSFGGNSCPGPKEEFGGDQSVAVTVALLEPHSCAWIGFRRQGDEAGYNAFLCPGEVTLSADTGDNRATLGTQDSTLLADGGDHRVELAVEDGVATVSVDGTRLTRARLDDRRLDRGWIELGVETDDQGPDGSVAFRDIEIRKG